MDSSATIHTLQLYKRPVTATMVDKAVQTEPEQSIPCTFNAAQTRTQTHPQTNAQNAQESHPQESHPQKLDARETQKSSSSNKDLVHRSLLDDILHEVIQLESHMEYLKHKYNDMHNGLSPDLFT